MGMQPDASPVTPTPQRGTSAVDRPFALHPPAMATGTGSSHHYRFADFDESFSEQAGVSAEQAKRALQAHLAETERRMTEAGRLGTALVQQQRELTEKLREVEQLEAQSELSPDLKKKLTELEKEYDDVARESARAFLPKQRIPSNESAGSPEGKGGRRSLSPVKYESQTSTSPGKVTISSRKQRNQTANRVHDIEFATEISTSLISQVRGLQALLAEREEELRETKQDLDHLEETTETLQERIKELDESEHRYKDENWNLEGRVHDLEASHREASDKEKKVAQAMALLQASSLKTQRELDELRGTHSRLADDHAAAAKHHDIELGTAKRNMAMSETENASLQRRIDELASQNQELARAVAMQHRSRAIDGGAVNVLSDEDIETAGDQVTPEHSPPASPIKGTPRHSVLESETLKTSLLHAQRTLQSLRTNLHREKTEKLELRRLLQDTRDDLERARADPNGGAAGGSRKGRNTREIQRLRANQLGGARSGRTELFAVSSADPDWEEINGEASPSAARARGHLSMSSDQFETADEHRVSDTEYTTANDGAETTDDFHTGAEEQSSEDTMTETEQDTTIRRRALISRGLSTAAGSATIASSAEHEYDIANQSTASMSDEDEYNSPRTPTSTLPGTGGVSRMRLRVSRSSLASRRMRQVNGGDEVGSSPAAVNSSPFSAADSPVTVALASSPANSTPRMAGQQSLFAELGELDEDSEEELLEDGTPSRQRSIRSTTGTPSSIISATHNVSRSSGMSPLAQSVTSSKIVTVDRASLTEAVTILPWGEEDGSKASRLLVSEAGVDSRPSSFLSDNSAGGVDVGEKLKEFPSPPSSAPRHGPIVAPIVLPIPFSHSSKSGDKEPMTAREVQTVPEELPVFTVSEVVSIPIEPVAEPEPPAKEPISFALSPVQTQHVTPKLPPIPEPVEAPVFSRSSIRTVNITPIELPPPVVHTPKPMPVPVPVPIPVSLPKEIPTFSLSAIQREHVQPIPEPVVERAPSPSPPTFSLSGIKHEHVQPISEPIVERALPPSPPKFSLSTVQREHVIPVATPKKPTPTMSFSDVFSQHVQPLVAEDAVKEVPLATTDGISASTQTDEWKPESKLGSIGAIGAATAFGAAATAALAHASSRHDDTAAVESGSRSPKRNAFIIPRDPEDIEPLEGTPSTPNTGLGSPVIGGWSKHKGPPTPIIAEDETRQSPSASPLVETPESERPFKEISVNAKSHRQVKDSQTTRSDAADQNAVPLSHIDEYYGGEESFNATPRAFNKTADTTLASLPESYAVGDHSSISGRRSRSGSHDSISSSVRRYRVADTHAGATSPTKSEASFPPLPANHREAIEAARTGSSHSAVATAGAVTAVAAAGAAWRVRTPTGTARWSNNRSGPVANGTAAIEVHTVSRSSSHANGSNTGGSVVNGAPGTLSRQTSLSSFASEVEARFHMNGAGDVFGNSHTDPRMIQAITQTMIGEYLWKYTRKAGRSGLSDNRHRRYFWIHPYTRMLFWSDQGPTADNKPEHRAKSVIIEGVRVVSDDNPMPPGLHRKSLVVISPRRTIKFTCTTGHRHEIWFNALSYLLLRNEETAEDDGIVANANGDHITREDVDEFNPSFGNRPAAGTQVKRRAPTLSSYNSRTTRTESPAFDMTMNIPTLTPKNVSGTRESALSHSASVSGSTRGRLSRIGSYWRSSQSLSQQFTSLRGRGSTIGHRHGHSSAQDGSIYEASEVNDSAEDLRVMYETQDRESDRLENVRACCDGKHDVGMLSHSSRHQRHSHGATSVLSTPTGTARRRP